jgi:hypothetical protein
MLYILKRLAFVIDVPLALFGHTAWMSLAIRIELSRINQKVRGVTGQDLLVLGIEKSGNFCAHFDMLDIQRDGAPDRLPNQKAWLLDNDYIKRHIAISKGAKVWGLDTYFGRKFFYKTARGGRMVATLAVFTDYQADTRTALPDQFPRLADAMSLLDRLHSTRYPNAALPLIRANAEAALPLNLGRKLLEDLAKELVANQVRS